MTENTNHRALEAEHRIVTVCTRWPKTIDRVAARPKHFVSPKWRACFSALQELRTRNAAVDELVLQNAVRGDVGLEDLVVVDGIPDMIEEYSRIVIEEHQRRFLRSGLSEVLTMGKAGATLEEMLDKISKIAMEAALGQREDAMTVSAIAEGRYLEIGQIAQAISDGDPSATGIPTGIPALDTHLGGVQTGIVTLLAGRPAMGKSTVALNITDHAASQGIGVHVFSLEDTRDAYADRVFSMHSGVSTSSIRSAKLNRGELQDLAAVQAKLKTRTGWIVDDRSGISAAEIVRCARRNAAKNNTRPVVVDYIQLIRGERGQDSRTRLSEAINTLGDAAKEDRMAYLVLSQLNRGLESREDKRPLLSDLKESGTLEERSKAVLMVYRDAEYNPCRCDKSKGACEHDRAMEIWIRKNSNGMTGKVSVSWEPERMRIGA